MLEEKKQKRLNAKAKAAAAAAVRGSAGGEQTESKKKALPFLGGSAPLLLPRVDEDRALDGVELDAMEASPSPEALLEADPDFLHWTTAKFLPTTNFTLKIDLQTPVGFEVKPGRRGVRSTITTTTIITKKGFATSLP